MSILEMIASDYTLPASVRRAFAPVEYVTCPACHGNGVLVALIDRCAYCNGRGYVVTEAPV